MHAGPGESPVQSHSMQELEGSEGSLRQIQTTDTRTVSLAARSSQFQTVFSQFLTLLAGQILNFTMECLFSYS